MTVPVILAIAGVVALLVGILGGGIKAKEIEISALSNSSRIIASVLGVIFIILSVIMSIPGVMDNIPPVPLSEPVETLFTLTDAKSDDFYTLESASFVLRSDGKLAVRGGFGQGVYINQLLPDNFRLTLQFHTTDPDDELIIGLSDGSRMRPNYHFVMASGRTAFKRQLSIDVTDDTWDRELKTTWESKFLLKPNTTNEIIFERKDGKVSIVVNSTTLFELRVQDIHDINNYDYLYLTGGIKQETLIDSLIVEKLEE